MFENKKHLSDRKFLPPISILIIGDEERAKVFTKEILDTNMIDKFDTMHVRPEESDGKSDIISLKQILQAQRFMNLTPNSACKAIIIEKASKIRLEAANSLLKILEEPPKYGVIILQSQRDDLLPTIISRCQRVDVTPEKETNTADGLNIIELLDNPFYIQSKEIESIVNDKRELALLNSFENHLRNRMRDEQTVKYSDYIKEIIIAKRDLKNNVSAKLVIESLILRYLQNV